MGGFDIAICDFKSALMPDCSSILVPIGSGRHENNEVFLRSQFATSRYRFPPLSAGSLTSLMVSVNAGVFLEN